MARGSRSTELQSLVLSDNNVVYEQQAALMPPEAAVAEDDAAPAPPLPPDVLMMILPRVKTAPGSGPQMVCKDWRDVLAPYEATLQWLAQGAAEQDLTTAVSKAAACPKADKSSGMVSDLLDDGLAEDVTTAEYLDTVRVAMCNAVRTGHSELCQQLVQRYDTVDAAEKAAAAAAQAAARAAAAAAAAANPAPVPGAFGMAMLGGAPLGAGPFHPGPAAGMAGFFGHFAHAPAAAALGGEDDDDASPHFGIHNMFGQRQQRPRQPLGARFQLLSAGIEGVAAGNRTTSRSVLPTLLAAVPQQGTGMNVCVQLVGEGLQAAAKNNNTWLCEELWNWLRTRYPLTQKYEFMRRLEGQPSTLILQAVVDTPRSISTFKWLDTEVFMFNIRPQQLHVAIKAGRYDIVRLVSQRCEEKDCAPELVQAAGAGNLGLMAAMLCDARWKENNDPNKYTFHKMTDDSRVAWFYKALKAAVAGGHDAAVRLLLGYPAAPEIQDAIVGGDEDEQRLRGFGRLLPRHGGYGGSHQQFVNTHALLLTCINEEDEATALQLVPHLNQHGDTAPALTAAVQHNMLCLCCGLLHRCPKVLTYEALTAADQLSRAKKLQMLGALMEHACNAAEDILTAAAASGSVDHVHLLLQNKVRATATALERGAAAEGCTDADRAALCRTLVEAGARLSGAQGTAALLAAAQLERLETCRVLVSAGADASAAKSLRWEAQQAMQREAQRARVLAAIEGLGVVDSSGAGAALPAIQAAAAAAASVPLANSIMSAASEGAAAAQVGAAGAVVAAATSRPVRSRQQTGAAAAQPQNAHVGARGPSGRAVHGKRARRPSAAGGRPRVAAPQVAAAVCGRKRGREVEDGSDQHGSDAGGTLAAGQSGWGAWASGVLRFFMRGPAAGKRAKLE